jgi:hypothetical protein
LSWLNRIEAQFAGGYASFDVGGQPDVRQAMSGTAPIQRCWLVERHLLARPSWPPRGRAASHQLSCRLVSFTCIPCKRAAAPGTRAAVPVSSASSRPDERF